MARDVADTALFFEAMAGFDRMDPYGQAVLPPEKRVSDLRGLRVGWLPEGGAKVDPEVAALTRAAVEAMSGQGAEVEEIDLDFKGLEPAFLTVLRAGLSSRVGPHVAKFGNQLDDTLLVRILEGAKLGANDLSAASYERTRFFRLLQQELDRFDVIISPVLTAPAIQISLDTAGEVEVAGNRGTIRGAWYPFTYPLNLTGHPAISMPCGRTTEGLPVGLQIMGRWYADRMILDVAGLLETLLGEAA